MKTLLVALKDVASPIARSVLDEALRLAQATGARLVLFRAVSLPPQLPSEVLSQTGGEAVVDAGELARQKARAELEALTVAIPPELLKGTQILIGSPWEAICEAAKREHADLILIGSHGHRPLDRILGTTAARVVNHADRSVLVVRPPDKK